MNQKIKRMVGIAILMAIVVVLQLLGQFIRFGPVSVSLVLVPIVVGSALYGPAAGAMLGATFSVVVLLQPDTSFFYGMSVVGTVLTVIVKGTAAGWLSGLVYKLLSKVNAYLAVLLPAITCPVINTAIFFVGCRVFFYNSLAASGIENVMTYVLTVFIGFNFIAELAVNILCCPVVMRVLHALKKA